jgi:hypothetical protein
MTKREAADEFMCPMKRGQRFPVETKDAMERVFVGYYPAGVVYADRERERGGDYARLAFLSYETLVLRVERDCPPVLALKIREHAKRYKAGDMLEVSSCGQTVLLGRGKVGKDADDES